MNISIEVEDEAWRHIPGLEDLTRTAATATFAAAMFDASQSEAAVLFTDDQTIRTMNAEWRGKSVATNVLSFPVPEGLPVPDGEAVPLGDVVLASGMVMREAVDQGKSLSDHTAHLIVHGLLHLLGYDHEDEVDAERMERLEAAILKGLGISDPYERQ